MPSPFRITISVDEDLYEALSEVAEDDQKGIPDVVRDAIHSYLLTIWGEGIGTTAEKAIKNKATNADALKAVQAVFPRAKTTLSSIAFYRSRMRKTDDKILTNAEAERYKRERGKK